MANVVITRYRSVGPVTSKFKVEGAVEFRDRYNHSVAQVTMPFGNADSVILNNAFGMKEQIQVSFVLMYRSDDYTDGTGTPSGSAPYSPEVQKQYIKDYLLIGTGKHYLTDHNSHLYEGRISDLEFGETGDQPVSIPVSFTFTVGRVLAA